VAGSCPRYQSIQLVLDRRTVRGARERGRALRVVGAPPVGAAQPAGYQSVEGAGDFLRLGGRQLPQMQLAQVDPVGAEPPQRLPARPVDVGRRSVLAGDRPLPGVEGVAELGGDDHLVAVTGQRPPEHPLAMPRTIDVRGVEEGDPQLQATAQRCDGLIVVGSAPAIRPAVQGDRPADRPAPEPDLADIDTATAQISAHRRPSQYGQPGTSLGPRARSRSSGQRLRPPHSRRSWWAGTSTVSPARCLTSGTGRARGVAAYRIRRLRTSMSTDATRAGHVHDRTWIAMAGAGLPVAARPTRLLPPGSTGQRAHPPTAPR
jgi:hypothetical protein